MVAEKYGDIIDAIYAGEQQVDVDTVITFQDGTKTRIQTQLAVATLIDAPTDASTNEHGGSPREF